MDRQKAFHLLLLRRQCQCNACLFFPFLYGFIFPFNFAQKHIIHVGKQMNELFIWKLTLCNRHINPVKKATNDIHCHVYANLHKIFAHVLYLARSTTFPRTRTSSGFSIWFFFKQIENYVIHLFPHYVRCNRQRVSECIYMFVFTVVVHP